MSNGGMINRERLGVFFDGHKYSLGWKVTAGKPITNYFTLQWISLTMAINNTRMTMNTYEYHLMSGRVLCLECVLCFFLDRPSASKEGAFDDQVDNAFPDLTLADAAKILKIDRRTATVAETRPALDQAALRF